MTTPQEAVREPRIQAARMVELDFPEAMLRVWTGSVAYTGGDGRVWQPVGHLGTIGAVRSTETLEADGLVLGLRRAATDAAVDPEAFVAAMNAERRRAVYGRDVALYLQVFDLVSGSEIGTPQPEFVGIMSHVETIREGAGSAEIRVHCEGYFAEGRTIPHGLYTAADQRARYPGDAACDLVPANADRILTWPRD